MTDEICSENVKFLKVFVNCVDRPHSFPGTPFLDELERQQRYFCLFKNQNNLKIDIIHLFVFSDNKRQKLTYWTV